MNQKFAPVPKEKKTLSLADGLRSFANERRKAGRLLAKKEQAEKEVFLKKHPNASTRYFNIRFSNPVERAKFDYGVGGSDLQSPIS